MAKLATEEKDEISYLNAKLIQERDELQAF